MKGLRGTIVGILASAGIAGMLSESKFFGVRGVYPAGFFEYKEITAVLYREDVRLGRDHYFLRIGENDYYRIMLPLEGGGILEVSNTSYWIR